MRASLNPMATWTYIYPCEIEQWMSQTWHIALGTICPGNEPKVRVYYLDPSGCEARWRSFSIQLEALCKCLFCSLISKSRWKR